MVKRHLLLTFLVGMTFQAITEGIFQGLGQITITQQNQLEEAAFTFLIVITAVILTRVFEGAIYIAAMMLGLLTQNLLTAGLLYVDIEEAALAATQLRMGIAYCVVALVSVYDGKEVKR